MRYMKILGLASVMAIAATALFGTGLASAANLYKYTTPSANDRLAIGTEIVLTQNTGSSMLMKDTLGGANDTCTGSQLISKIEKDTSSEPSVHAQGKVSSLSIGVCSHTTTTLSNGELEFKNIAGTTNGSVISRGARITLKSTIFGISCIANTGAGTVMGTLTGAKGPTANATMDLNGVISLENGCGDSTWIGSFTVTSPAGTTVESS